MNPLGNGNISGGLSPQVLDAIKKVKVIMRTAKGDPTALIQQMNNPMANQILQMLQSQNSNDVFMAMAKNMGVDPNAILRELQN